MTKKATLLCTATLLIASVAFAPQQASAQLLPAYEHMAQSHSQIPQSGLQEATMVWIFGPQVGFDASLDAFTLGAFAMVTNMIASLPELRFLAEAAYGIGLDDNAFDYSTFRVGVMAAYLVLATDAFSVLPIAGLGYHRLTVEDSFGFGITASGSDIALVIGGMIVFGKINARLTLNAGGVSDISATVAYGFGG